MSLYYPAFLLALVTAALPIIIHMLFRKKSKSMEFSTLRFLSSEAVKAGRRSRIKQWLLLLVRFLIITILVILFAAPYRKNMPAEIVFNPEADIYCWVDPTLSMDYKKDGITLWREGLELINLLDSVSNAKNSIKIWNSPKGRFTDINIAGGFNRSYVKYRNIDISEALNRYVVISRESKKIPVFVLVSDFQIGLAEKIEKIFQNDSLREFCFFVNISDKNAFNYSVSEPGISGSGTSLLRCKVKAYGGRLDSAVLRAQQGRMNTGYKTISVPEWDSIEVDIASSTEEDVKAGRIVLDVKDNLPEDNHCYFSSQNKRKKDILLISDYKKAFPLIAAFNNISNPVWNKPIVKEPENTTYLDVENSDIIIINAVSEISEEINSLLTDNVRNRKLILYSPVSEKEQGSLNSAVLSYLGGLSTVKYRNREEPAYLKLTDTVSVIWKDFPRITERDVNIYSYMRPLNGEKLCMLDNGDVFTSMYKKKHGHIWLVTASSIGITNDNNICETGFYLPFLDRIVRYGIQYLGNQGAGGWTAGVSKKNPFYGRNRAARVYDSEAKLVYVWKNQPRVKIETPGIYTLIPENGDSRKISVNLNPAESRTEYAGPVLNGLSDKKYKSLTGKEFKNYLLRGSKKTPFSNVLWILLFGFVIVEPLLWKKRSRNQHAGVKK